MSLNSMAARFQSRATRGTVACLPSNCPWRIMHPVVVAVSSNPRHTMAKANQASIRLVKGIGVEGDAHAGITVKHRSRVARDPSQPNLRQVHLIHAELHDELRPAGFATAPA